MLCSVTVDLQMMDYLQITLPLILVFDLLTCYLLEAQKLMNSLPVLAGQTAHRLMMLTGPH